MTPQEKSALYYQANKEKYNTPEHKARRKAYRARNKEHIKIKKREHTIKNKTNPKSIERQRRYYLEHKHIYYPRQQERRKERMKTDLNYRFTTRIRNQIYDKIKNGSGKRYTKSIELLGCSVEDTRRHIESLWLPGMSWDNYGIAGWHIDHIQPCCTFDLTDLEQQKKCFHYTNLRPLWAKDNLRRPKRGADIKRPETATLEK